MPRFALVSVFCPDRTGLVAAVTGRLFDLGINLADTSFSVLGSGAELTAVCECPDTLSLEELEGALRDMRELEPAEIRVSPFKLDPRHGPTGNVTHHVTVRGGDQPGLVARICEVFVEFRANIVRLDAGTEGAAYAIRLAVFIPPAGVEACLSTLKNTAEGMQLTFESEAV